MTKRYLSQRQNRFILECMESLSRHQCLIYDGPPSRQLRAIAAATHGKLTENYRCIYLNSKPMVAGLRSYLAAEGVDVERETLRGALILSADQAHLVQQSFDIDAMLRTLDAEVSRALHDGYAGLWASGDITWELGPDKDFGKLMDYEYRLEEFMREHPQFSGICQYHAESLPRELLGQALLQHKSVFVNETLSILNSHYVDAPLTGKENVQTPQIANMISRLLELGASYPSPAPTAL
jgi:hypothetical protein